MLTLLIVIALFGAAPVNAMGWKGSPEDTPTAVFDQPYDVSREVAFEGKVTRVDPAACVALPVSSSHLHVQGPDETVEVHLGPCWYVLNQKPQFKVGDAVSVIGAEATWKSGPRRVIMVREIRRGNVTLRLRNAAGKPAWR